MLDPNSAHYNPTGYAHAKAQFEQAHSVLAQLQQAQAAEMQWLGEQQAVQQHALGPGRSAQAHARRPEFRDRRVYEQFWADANEVMASEYGFSPEELALTVDHRFYKPMRDLVRFHKARQRLATGAGGYGAPAAIHQRRPAHGPEVENLPRGKDAPGAAAQIRHASRPASQHSWTSISRDLDL